MSFLDIVAGFLSGIVAMFSVIFGHRQPAYMPPVQNAATQQQAQATTSKQSSSTTTVPSQQPAPAR